MRPDKRERRPCPWGDVQRVGKQHDTSIVDASAARALARVCVRLGGDGPQMREAHRDPVLWDRASLALRVAWLRVQGDLLFDVDQSGQLSAQLFDLADLLEALDAEGRWAA